MIRLFCYGSNSLKQLKERLETNRKIVAYAAYAKGWQRIFRGYSEGWKGGVASLRKNPEKKTFGFVAELTKAEIEILDMYEGSYYELVPLYVQVLEDDVFYRKKSYAYIRIDNESKFSKPSNAYLKAVVYTINSFWSQGGGNVRISDIPLV